MRNGKRRVRTFEIHNIARFMKSERREQNGHANGIPYEKQSRSQFMFNNLVWDQTEFNPSDKGENGRKG